MVLYTYYAVKEAIELIWTTSKFQDFPGPNPLSRTFQVLEIL